MGARLLTRTRGLVAGLGFAVATALYACSVPIDERPRPELTGEAFGGFGGALSLGGGGSGATTTSSGTGGQAGAGAGCDPGFGEPNDGETADYFIGTIDDCDSHGASLVAVLASADADWYRYKGTDASGCVVDPAATLNTTGGGARLCQFAECLFGATSVTCQSGTSAISPAGREGCCDSQNVAMDIDCAGLNDDAYIYLRVDFPSASCVSYGLDYHY